MPVKTVIHSAIAGVAVIAALSTMTACSSSGNKAATTSSTPPPTASTTSTAPTTSAPPSSSSAAATPADAATKAAVTKAYTLFFGGTKDQAKLVADLQNGTKLAAALAAEAKNPTAATLTATVSAVTLANPHVANVTFTLLSKGAVLLPNQPGKAVLVNGTWQLAAETFCGLVAAGGTIPPQCTDQSIIGLPTS